MGLKRVGAYALIAGLAGCASIGGPPPPADTVSQGAAERPSASSSKGARGGHVVPPGANPHREYFDQRARRYYYFDVKTKRYYWENGEPKY